MSTTESRAKVEGFYEEFSFDAGVRDWLKPNGRHDRMRIELDDMLGGAQDLRILDVGCAGGNMASVMCRYGAVTGLDLSRSATELAAVLEPRARFEAGAIEQHEPSGVYDLVTLFDVVEHIPPQERPALFREIGRVLSPRGRVMLTTPHPDFLRWVQEHRPELLQVVDEPIDVSELIELGAAIGLELITYRTYQLDAPGARQYQMVVLARPGELYRPAFAHRLRTRLYIVANRRVPALGRAVQAARLARAGRLRAAAWMAGLVRRPPLR